MSPQRKEMMMRIPKSSIQNKKPGLGGRLTIKQRRFVDAYIRNGGNGTGAVFDAGYETDSERSAQVIASQNLKKPVIMLALEEAGYVDCGLIDTDRIEKVRSFSGKVQGIGSREERAAFLTSVYENESHPIGARLKAAELVCKMYGDFLEKVVIQEKPVEMPIINFIYPDDE